jgi:hypothetical protein
METRRADNRQLMIPIDPLVAAMEREAKKQERQVSSGGWTGVAYLFYDNASLRRQYQKAKERGWITPKLADRVCTYALGCHPAEVYDEDWYEW